MTPNARIDPCRIPQGVDGHVGPEARAVAAHTPALVGVAAPLGGQRQFPAGLVTCAPGSACRTAQGRPVISEAGTPVRRSALGVPGDDAAGGVEQDDGFVRHLRHERTDGTLGRPRSRSGATPPGLEPGGRLRTQAS